jgi:hypothetical protein
LAAFGQRISQIGPAEGSQQRPCRNATGTPQIRMAFLLDRRLRAMNTITRRISIALLFAISVSVAGAADKLNVKTGLWEITTVSHISGSPPLPKEVLERMTPQQRAEMAAAIKEQASKGPQTDTDRQCLTQKDLDHPFESADSEDCTHTIVRTTRTSQEMKLSCTGKHKGSGSLRVNATTPESMNGELDIKIGEGSDVMTIKSQLKGRWLGPDCGDEDETDDSDADGHDEDESPE